MGLAASALKAGGLGGPGIGALGAGAAAAGALANGAEKQKGWWVPDGFVAVRTRFGRARFKDGIPIVKSAGFHPNMPGTHANKFISIQDRVCSLGQIAIEREDELTLVHAAATWGIKGDPESAHAAWLKVKAGELDERFAAICGNAFRIVMSTVPLDRVQEINQKIRWDGEDRSELDTLIAQKKQLARKIVQVTQEVAAEELIEIGSEIRGISIRSDAPHPFEVFRGQTANGAIAAATESGEFSQEGAGVSLVPIAGA